MSIFRQHPLRPMGHVIRDFVRWATSFATDVVESSTTGTSSLLTALNTSSRRVIDGGSSFDVHLIVTRGAVHFGGLSFDQGLSRTTGSCAQGQPFFNRCGIAQRELDKRKSFTCDSSGFVERLADMGSVAVRQRSDRPACHVGRSLYVAGRVTRRSESFDIVIRVTRGIGHSCSHLSTGIRSPDGVVQLEQRS
jgi:hypothetical protein